MNREASSSPWSKEGNLLNRDFMRKAKTQRSKPGVHYERPISPATTSLRLVKSRVERYASATTPVWLFQSWRSRLSSLFVRLLRCSSRSQRRDWRRCRVASDPLVPARVRRRRWHRPRRARLLSGSLRTHCPRQPSRLPRGRRGTEHSRPPPRHCQGGGARVLPPGAQWNMPVRAHTSSPLTASRREAPAAARRR
jgi:hypothetical protein